MAGSIDFMSAGMSGEMPILQSGGLIALPESKPQRTPALPNVPTTIEQGFPDSDYYYWMGMLVPSKTPRAIID
jgi:tripartite-type tricarboxylate transporter receptor subunit TctC